MRYFKGAGVEKAHALRRVNPVDARRAYFTFSYRNSNVACDHERSLTPQYAGMAPLRFAGITILYLPKAGTNRLDHAGVYAGILNGKPKGICH